MFREMDGFELATPFGPFALRNVLSHPVPGRARLKAVGVGELWVDAETDPE
jgi:hypothetical protein